MLNNRYTYRAEWSPEDEEYVGLVAEFPSLSWLATTAAEAIAGAERLVDDILADMKQTGEIPPAPLTERRYSGNVSLRTSPYQHRRLAIEAAEQGVSINQWIVQRLSAPRGDVLSAVPDLVDELRSVLSREIEQLQAEIQEAHRIVVETRKVSASRIATDRGTNYINASSQNQLSEIFGSLQNRVA